uniref:Uncharacterized protein n=1 Tax=Opuntia streptacantha TaxID=393608 RepID=A0A7C9CUM3_OPUST
MRRAAIASLMDEVKELFAQHRLFVAEQNRQFLLELKQLMAPAKQSGKPDDSAPLVSVNGGETQPTDCAESEVVSNDDGCAEQHLLDDAYQVFDESPKRTAQIKPGELVGEGQEKLLEGSEVVADEPLDVSDTRLEQASVDHLGKGTHKPSLGSCVVIPLVAVNVFPEVESKLMVLDDDVDTDSPPWIYTIRDQQGLGSLVFHYPDVCIVVFAETIEPDFFKEFQKEIPTSIFASGVARLVFDPGGCLLNPYKLLARQVAGEKQNELL